jgi:hypothetical protein
MADSTAQPTHDQEWSVEDLRKAVTKGRALLGEIRGLFEEASELPSNDRRSSTGKMGLEESKVLRCVVDAIEVEPTLFASLADEDEGHDPNRLETELIRDRFDRHDLYVELAADIAALAKVMSDTALQLGALVKPVTLAAYEIGKPLSKRNPKIREKMAPALNHYGSRGRAAAVTRLARKKKPEA